MATNPINFTPMSHKDQPVYFTAGENRFAHNDVYLQQTLGPQEVKVYVAMTLTGNDAERFVREHEDFAWREGF